MNSQSRRAASQGGMAGRSRRITRVIGGKSLSLKLEEGLTATRLLALYDIR
jgi:hypothetical protein